MRHNTSYKKEDLGVRFYRSCGYIIWDVLFFLFIVRRIMSDMMLHRFLTYGFCCLFFYLLWDL